MAAKLKLSICILAYNQPEDVNKLLSGLQRQSYDDVEIVIKDDSEGTETQVIVSRYKNIKNLRYIKGIKEGIDKTVVFLVQEARGDFIWWMGDDEIIDGGVSKVLDVINCDDSIGFIWANYKLFGTDIKGINIVENRLFDDPDEILLEAGTGIGFISACILKKEIAMRALEGARKYYGTAFSNLYITLFTITNARRSYCIADTIVICHPASSEEIKSITTVNPDKIINNAFQVFGINFYEIVRSFESSFKRKYTLRRVIRKSFGQTWRGVLVGWAGGWDTPKNKRVLLLKYFWNFPESWVAFILFCMPGGINKLMYEAYRKVKYSRISR